MTEPERSDDDLDFGSGASTPGTEDSEFADEAPTVDTPTLVDDSNEAEVPAAEPASPDDPLEAVSDFLDDFIDSDDMGADEGMGDEGDLEG